MRETWVWSLGWEDPLEKGKATHSSILAWRIPWTIQSMGLQRVGHDWATFTSLQESLTAAPGIARENSFTFLIKGLIIELSALLGWSPSLRGLFPSSFPVMAGISVLPLHTHSTLCFSPSRRWCQCMVLGRYECLPHLAMSLVKGRPTSLAGAWQVLWIFCWRNEWNIFWPSI